MHSNIKFLLDKALESLRASNLDLAELYLNQANKIQKNNPHTLRLLGVTAAQRKEHSKALDYLNNSILYLPKNALALSNIGNVYLELRDYEKSIKAYDRSINLDPSYEEAWSNKGNALFEIKCYEEAIEHYDEALRLNPNYAEAWSNKGNTLFQLKRYEEAIEHYDEALRLNPSTKWAYGLLINTKMKVCDWSFYDEICKCIFNGVKANQKVTHPFTLMALTDDALLHQQASNIFAKSIYPENNSLGAIPKVPKSEKIRIGYFSSDFKDHPVAHLTSELFKTHDRNQFEVIAFSLHPSAVGDKINSYLREVFDKFIDASNISDEEVAHLSRELKIDIAIDLSGPTENGRPAVFSYRAAPIQVNWLGFPGTFGAEFIDYIIADQIVIPKEHQSYYNEKIAYLPNSFMVDDSKRIASLKSFTRVECQLPENKFVYCCFNNFYKLNPTILDSWSRIFLEVKNSVLWLSKSNQEFESNLVAEFERRGIDSKRLIFAKRQDLMGDHLCRHRLADLFLDTMPYNAHTTAVDSLKSGLPVLTALGNSFPSRVAASLLESIGLQELIAKSQEEYEWLAIELAKNPSKLSVIRNKLASNYHTRPLFNTPLFTRNIEAAYIKMYERYHQNLSPDHIYVN